MEIFFHKTLEFNHSQLMDSPLGTPKDIFIAVMGTKTVRTAYISTNILSMPMPNKTKMWSLQLSSQSLEIPLKAPFEVPNSFSFSETTNI